MTTLGTDERHCLTNVARQFRSLTTRGDRIAVRAGFTEEFADRRYSVLHDKEGKDNHFQGVFRLGRHLLVTGSFPYSARRADLLVFRFDSRGDDPGPWGSNVDRVGTPFSTDRMIGYFAIDSDFWHAGSLAIHRNTAIVPLEGFGANSVITLVDLTDPSKPKRISAHDIRRDTKAGVCAVTPLASGQLLLAVWCDSDKLPDGTPAPHHLDLYLSRIPGSPLGFDLAARFLPLVGHPFRKGFQSLDFVWERSATERLFLIGFEHTGAVQPLPKLPFPTGTNQAYLFEVDLPPDWRRSEAAAAPPVVAALPQTFTRLVDTRPFESDGLWFNLDAGACAYVDSNQQLIVYAVSHHLSTLPGETGGEVNSLLAAEFRATDFADEIDRLEDAWVEIYEKPALGGRRLTVLGPLGAPIADTAKLRIEDKKFERARSARFQIPAGRAFVLYRATDWSGDGPLVLAGTGVGRSVEIDKTTFGKFKSCRFQSLSAAEAIPGAITA